MAGIDQCACCVGNDKVRDTCGTCVDLSEATGCSRWYDPYASDEMAMAPLWVGLGILAVVALALGAIYMYIYASRRNNDEVEVAPALAPVLVAAAPVKPVARAVAAPVTSAELATMPVAAAHHP